MHYILDNMSGKKILISLKDEDCQFLMRHPELNKSELFHIAVREYKKQHFDEVKA